MASFRAHISLGIASGVLGVMGLISLVLADEPGFMTMVFVAAVLGSILPDMDSDSGVPFHVAFGSFSTIAAGLVAVRLMETAPGQWERMLIWSVATFGFVYLVLGYFFKRFTRHRGMAHSLPAALLTGLVTFFLAARLSFIDTEAFLLALAMMAGYIGHLILDELYAAVNFHGTPFIPNKALGSALKLFADDTLANLGVYGAILFLLAGQVGRFVNLAEKFWRAVA